MAGRRWQREMVTKADGPRMKGRCPMRSTRLIPALTALVVLGGLLLRATPAGAAFPGPDGRIAFGSDRYGSTHNIFTMNPNGSDVLQLTFLTVDQGAALFQS